MKKTLLSVVAAGLVATAVAPVALAKDVDDAKAHGKEINDQTNGWSQAEREEAANYLRSLREPRLKAPFKAEKAPAKTGVKALPKTSAVK